MSGFIYLRILYDVSTKWMRPRESNVDRALGKFATQVNASMLFEVPCSDIGGAAVHNLPYMHHGEIAI